MAPSIFNADALHHHLISSLLLETYSLLFLSRHDGMSQMFSFTEKVHAVWLKDKAGNINQFLPFCGVKHFLFLYLGQCSALGTKMPKDSVKVKCDKDCISELKQCESHLFLCICKYL